MLIAKKVGDLGRNRVAEGHWRGLSTLPSNHPHDGSMGVLPYLAPGVTDVSRAFKELPGNHWRVTCTELLIVPLHQSCLKKRKLSECDTIGRGHAGKHEAAYSTTTPCDQVWKDVTTESQAGFQPERIGLSPRCRASRREKKGRPSPTEQLSTSAVSETTSKIQAILFTCNSINTTLPPKIWEDSFWWKASKLEFRIHISSVNKEMSKLYET